MDETLWNIYIRWNRLMNEPDWDNWWFWRQYDYSNARYKKEQIWWEDAISVLMEDDPEYGELF